MLYPPYLTDIIYDSIYFTRQCIFTHSLTHAHTIDMYIVKCRFSFLFFFYICKLCERFVLPECELRRIRFRFSEREQCQSWLGVVKSWPKTKVPKFFFGDLHLMECTIVYDVLSWSKRGSAYLWVENISKNRWWLVATTTAAAMKIQRNTTAMDKMGIRTRTYYIIKECCWIAFTFQINSTLEIKIKQRNTVIIYTR